MTNEEAMRVLKTMRTDADVHANICGATGGEKFIRKRDALDMAIESMGILEKLYDAMDQVFDKYLAHNLASKLKSEIGYIVSGDGSEEVTTCERNEPPSGS